MTEVVVIGGGVAGAGAAYRLARGGARVTLVDRADQGQATAAGAGILSPANGFASSNQLLALAKNSAAYYSELIDQLADDGETDTGYATPGAIYIAVNDDELQRLPERLKTARERQDAGFSQVGEITSITPTQAQRLFPPLAQIRGAIHVSGAARVDGRRLRDALRRAAERRGASIETGSATIETTADLVRAVHVEGRSLAADAVVLAAGAWSNVVGEGIGVAIPVHPQRGQIAHLEIPETDTGGWPTVLGFHSHYIVTFPPHRVVGGATREDHAGFGFYETAGGVHEILHEALRVAPGLASARLHEVRIGFRPASADNLPIIGPTGRYRNLYLATGFGPSGLQLAPYSAALAADLALGKPAPIDIHPFSPDRFA